MNGPVRSTIPSINDLTSHLAHRHLLMPWLDDPANHGSKMKIHRQVSHLFTALKSPGLSDNRNPLRNQCTLRLTFRWDKRPPPLGPPPTDWWEWWWWWWWWWWCPWDRFSPPPETMVEVEDDGVDGVRPLRTALLPALKYDPGPVADPDWRGWGGWDG